jgi:hypothetical protein
MAVITDKLVLDTTSAKASLETFARDSSRSLKTAETAATRLGKKIEAMNRDASLKEAAAKSDAYAKALKRTADAAAALKAKQDLLSGATGRASNGMGNMASWIKGIGINAYVELGKKALEAAEKIYEFGRAGAHTAAQFKAFEGSDREIWNLKRSAEEATASILEGSGALEAFSGWARETSQAIAVVDSWVQDLSSSLGMDGGLADAVGVLMQGPFAQMINAFDVFTASAERLNRSLEDTRDWLHEIEGTAFTAADDKAWKERLDSDRREREAALQASKDRDREGRAKAELDRRAEDSVVKLRDKKAWGSKGKDTRPGMLGRLGNAAEAQWAMFSRGFEQDQAAGQRARADLGEAGNALVSGLGLNTLLESMTKVAEKFTEFDDDLARSRAAMKQFGEDVETAFANSFINAFDAIISGTASFREVMAGTIGGLLDELATAFAAWAATEWALLAGQPWLAAITVGAMKLAAKAVKSFGGRRSSGSSSAGGTEITRAIDQRRKREEGKKDEIHFYYHGIPIPAKTARELAEAVSYGNQLRGGRS